MNDTDLRHEWSLLEPAARQRARIETQVFEWIEASEMSLASEWLGLLKVEPMKALAFVSVGAVPLVLLTPLGLMLTWLVP
jgi:hypothetical protein